MMIYNVNTSILTNLLIAFAVFLIVVKSWKFWGSKEIRFLNYLGILVLIWVITQSAEILFPNVGNKLLWLKLSFFGIAFMPACYFLFASSFKNSHRFISLLKTALLLSIPFIMLVLVLSNNKHQLMWVPEIPGQVNTESTYHYGNGIMVFLVYACFLVAAGLLKLIKSFRKSHGLLKLQLRTLIIASLISVAGSIIDISGFNPIQGFDVAPVFFLLSLLTLIYGIFRFNLLNIIPLIKTKIFESFNDGVIVIGINNRIEYCNPVIYKIFNLKINSIVHEKFDEIFKPYHKLTDGLSKNIASIQLKIKHQKNTHYYQITISPVYYENEVTGNILLFHDITSVASKINELEKANENLEFEIEKRERLIEDLDAFSHTVAHDLRNSLSSIFSASEIMEEIIKINDHKLLCELSNLINYSANKSIQITHELLLLATTDKTDVEMKTLDMAKIYSEAKNQLKNIIVNSGAQITEPEEWPQATGYAPWIEEVWSNYLSNAIKYGGNPPEIEVGADILLGGKVRFWIKDNGKGLTCEEQGKLFKNFVRLNPQKADGYGLGLSIVKKITEKLDGSVGVESNGLGEGSKFYFVLNSPKLSHYTAKKQNREIEYVVN